MILRSQATSFRTRAVALEGADRDTMVKLLKQLGVD
jgi:hypothetical protein